jgi:excisionase family DNA binding protein
MPDDEFLTVAEIAERLKLNPQTVRNWIDRGDMASVRLGSRRVRVLSSELDRFINESSSAQTPDEDAARAEFNQALNAVQATTTNGDLSTALRRLAKAANRLARALPPDQGG